MNKKLMEFGAFLVMLFLVIFAVIVYIMKYLDLSSLNKIDGFSIVLGSLVMLNIVLYSSKALERVYKRNKLGKIICLLKPDVPISPLLLTILSGTVLVVWLNLYIKISPSFIGLSMIIVFSIMVFDSFAVYLSEIGIAEKGIVDGTNFYLWNEVLSYTYHEKDNKLIVSVKSKYLFLRINGKSKLCYKSGEKIKIDQINSHMSMIHKNLIVMMGL